MSSDDSQMMDHTIHKPYDSNLNRMLDLLHFCINHFAFEYFRGTFIKL